MRGVPPRPSLVACLAMVLVVMPVRASTLILAVPPQATPVEMGQRWTPLLERLEHDTLLRFQLRAYPRHDAFERDLAAGIPDLALLDSRQITWAASEQGYQPLVYSSRPLVAVLVASDVGGTGVTAKTGRRVALSSGNAAAVLVPALEDAADVQPIEAHRPRNVHRHVLLGHADLGVSTDVDLAREPVSVRQRLHVIERSAALAGHALAVHPRVTQAQRQRLRAALLRLRGELGGQSLLEAVDLADVRAMPVGDRAASIAPMAPTRDVVKAVQPPPSTR